MLLNLNMNNQGWIKLHRKLIDTSFYKNANAVRLLIHLLIICNHNPNKFYWNGSEIEIKSGQVITGRKELSRELGISEQSIRSALTTLKSTNTITIKSTNRFSLIEICKWSDYQSPSTSRSTSKITNNQPTTNQQLTTNNNDKNNKNNKNTTNVVEKPTYGNPDINEAIRYFKEIMGLPILDESVETNRRYCNLSLKKYGGLEKVKMLIDATKHHPFWSTRVTSFKSLYYKGVEIISSLRSSKNTLLKL